MKKKLFKIFKRTVQFFLKPFRPFFDNYIYTMRQGPAKGLKRKGGFMFIPFLEVEADKRIRGYQLQDKVVYDIGANIGLMTLAYSKYIGNGKIYSFEPNPDTFTLLKEIVKINGLRNVEVFNLAIGASRSEDELLVHKGQRGIGSLNKNIKKSFSEMGNNKSYLVSVYPLDLLIEQFKIDPPDFIKIDTEGFEYDCLLGMQNILKKFQPEIEIEMHSKAVSKNSNSNAQNVIDNLLSLKYDIYHLEQKTSLRLENHELADRGHLFCRYVP